MKKLLFLFLLYYSAAQAQVLHWAIMPGDTPSHNSPGSFGVYGTTSTMDFLSNTYVTGINGVVKKIDSSGNVVMTTTIPGDGYGITVDNMGHIYVAGLSSQSSMLVKLDTAGNIIWFRTFASGPSSSHEYGASSLSLDHYNNIYVAGVFHAGADFDPGPAVHTEDTGGSYVAKFDTAGNYIWVRVFRGAGMAGVCFSGNAITTDANGNVYTGVQLGCSSTAKNARIQKYDSSGNALWSHDYPWSGLPPFGGTAGYKVYSMIVSDSNYLYITGVADFRTDMVAGTTFVHKMDLAGNTIWLDKFAGVTGDWRGGIAVDHEGNAYIAGVFQPIMCDLDPGPGTYYVPYYSGYPGYAMANCLVEKLGPTGNFIWGDGYCTLYNGNPLIEGCNIAVDDHCNVYMTGYLYDAPNVDVAPGSGVYNLSGTGLFVEKFNCDITTASTGVANNHSLSNSLIYPNPTDKTVHINAPANIDKLTITDISGRIVYSKEKLPQDITLEMPTTGMYFVTISYGSNTITQKLLVNE